MRTVSTAIVLSVLGLWVMSADVALAQGCGAYSLADLCDLTGRAMSPDQRQRARVALSSPECSMLDVRKHAKSIGIELTPLRVTLARLQEMEMPAIIHLSAPAHFIVLERLSEQWAQLIDNGATVLLPVSELTKRYTGNALVCPRKETGGPRLRIEPFCYCFGVAGIGENVEYSFKIRNIGGQDLIVQPQPKGCCGAPDVAVANDAVPPGECAQVTVKFVVRESGDVFKSATVLTNDPDQPLVHLSVLGYATPEVTAVPDRVRMRLIKGSNASQMVDVRGPRDMVLLGARCVDGTFDVRTGDPSDRDGVRTWRIELWASGRAKIGTWVDTLEIATSSVQRPKIIVPLTAVVESDLRIDPPMVFLGFVQPNHVAEFAITVGSRSFSNFNISAPTVTSSQIKLGKPLQYGPQWVIPVSVAAPTPQKIDSLITIHTDVPGEETITVPAHGLVIER